MTYEEVKKELEQLQAQIENYEDLDCSMDEPEYVARGNGFCDAKYSEEFITSQLARLRDEMENLEKRFATFDN